MQPGCVFTELNLWLLGFLLDDSLISHGLGGLLDAFRFARRTT